MRSLLACALLLSAGMMAPGPTLAQPDTPTPCCDDDFGGGFEATLYLTLGGGFLILMTSVVLFVESVTPDPDTDEPGDG